MRSCRSFAHGAVVTALVLTGCVAENPRGASGTSTAVPFLGAALPAENAAKATTPAGGWETEALAVRAGERARHLGAGALETLVARLKAAEAVAWKEPELRYGLRWGDSSADRDSFGSAGSYDSWRHDDGDSYASTIGARFYVPNPFINHYLRQKGAASVARSEAKAATEAYGVYTEVRLLCHEYERVTAELARSREADRILARGRSQTEAGLNDGAKVSPYDVIRTRAQLERNRMKTAALERTLARLARQIATAADVESAGFALAPASAALPAPDSLSLAALTEIAFARRPDLARALSELDEAEAGLGAAKAATIPWFRFIEAGYRHTGGDEDSYTHAAGGAYHSANSDDHGDAAYVKVALTVPIFTWFGDTISLSRAVRDAADARVRGLYGSIRDEIAAALERYRAAYERVHAEEVESFAGEMRARIAECETSGAEVAGASLKARLELNDYLAFADRQAAAAREALYDLESVVGGPVTAPSTAAK